MKNHVKIDKANVEDILGLTPMQEGMLYHYISNPESRQYFEQICLNLTGKLNMQHFTEAWDHVVRQNEMLRAIFRWDGLDSPVQIILKEHKLSIRVYNLASEEADGNRLSLEEIMAADYEEGIDICSEPMRVTVCIYGQDKYSMLISSHHIIFDGWSTGVLLAELFGKYNELVKGRKGGVTGKTRFKEYIKWLKAQDKELQRHYWRKYLEGFDTRTVLPEDYKKLGNIRQVKRLVHTLGDDFSQRLKHYAVVNNVTPAALLYCAWGILLQRYNNTDDVIFGITVSGRPSDIRGIEDIVGLFINTLPLRVKSSDGVSISELIKKVNEDLKEHEANSSTSLADIKKYSGFNDAGEFFSSLAVIDNYPLDEKLDLSGCGLSADSYSLYEMTNYDLTLQVMMFNGIELHFNYNCDIFKPQRIQRLIGHYVNILGEIISKPAANTADIEILTAYEKKQLLVDFNDTKTEYPDNKTIHKLFEERARIVPERVAVSDGERTLTYRQLNEKANQLARVLRDSGAGSNTIIALAVPRSLEMIIGILGIFKANGICLPLDIGHPEERINMILEDSAAPILLELEGHSYVKSCQGKLIKISKEVFEAECKDNLEDTISSADLAYIIYTSGSTGRPKGAMLHHKGIINHIYTKVDVLELTEEDVVGSNFSVNVVASIWQILSPLLIGAKLVIHSEEVERSPYEQFRRISEDGITIIEVIPSILNAYIDLLEKGERRINLPKLRKIALTSEETKPVLVNKFHKQYDITLVDCYGQTECCDDTLHYTIPVSDSTEVVPIGKPSHNTRAYILDRNDKLQPIGIIGELCISGDGVTAGYWNRQELTREKFVANPYEKGSVLYRTGDLARWRDDGNVECFGRIDHQVKIRGNRIELGEIETQILKYPGVRSAAVIAKEDEDGEKFLSAYIVSEQELTISELRLYLSKALPDYSIPSQFIRLENMPLTPNMKIDRKVLCTVEGNMATGAEYVAPRNRMEKKILDIWKDILQRDKIGVNDNFFDCGGHSLLLIKMQSRIYKETGKNVSLVEILQYPTISALSRFLAGDMYQEEEAENCNSSIISSGKKDGIDDEIAIIGMSGRFPGANSIEEFWSNLKSGTESIAFFGDNELEITDESLKSNPRYVRAWGVLDDIEFFDASFFGFTPREAELMDPQQRLFMECAWEALESSGYSTEHYKGKIGIYAGMGMSTYLLNNIASDQELVNSAGNFQIAIGNDKDFLATRTSYKLNAKGPGISIQTACSTSMTAVHIACRGIANGECDIAIAGAAHIKVPQKSGYLYEAGGNMSPDGRCKTFDAAASGSVMGNGVGVVVLKRLADALNDGDHIYAVIKGSAANNDGSAKAGFTAPSIEGQAEVIMAAQAKAGIRPDTIGYIEAHGTGTELGDPVELTALEKAFGRHTRRKSFCAIGALKSNIGHLDVAAGVAGLIKTALILKHGEIPPSLNFELPNPKFDFADSCFYVNTCLQHWKATDAPRRAGVSSFGIGGTNVHVVLEEPPYVKPAQIPLKRHLMLISAKTSTALEKATKNLEVYLRKNPEADISNVAYTLQLGRSTFDYRRMFICNDRESALALLENHEDPRVYTMVNGRMNPPVVFVFTAQPMEKITADYDLYLMHPSYRRNIDLCTAFIKSISGIDLKELLYKGKKNTCSAAGAIEDIKIGNAVQFILQYSLASLWTECGIKPQYVSGKGVGEYAAACIAGVMEPEDALKRIMKLNNGDSLFSSGQCIRGGRDGILLISADDTSEICNIYEYINKYLPEDRYACLLVGRRDYEKLSEEIKRDNYIIDDLIPSGSDDKAVITDTEMLLQALGRLWIAGVNIRWTGLYGEGKYSRIPLPTYPFERQYYWIEKKNNAGSICREEVLAKKPELDEWFYIPTWKRSYKTCISNYDKLRDEQECWLVFNDDIGIGSCIAERLRSLGHDVVSVHKGNSYLKPDYDSYIIDPKKEENYKALIKEIGSSGRVINNVLHLWSLDKPEASLDKFTDFTGAQFMGFYSLMFLVRALSMQNTAQPIEAWIVSSDIYDINGSEALCPERSTITGLCKVVHQEHSNIFCRNIDFDSHELEGEGKDWLVQCLLAELALKSGDAEAAYRSRKRWVRDFEQVQMDEISSRSIRLRNKGTYLITGGLGDIGHVFAEYISKTYQANLILTGRTPLPEKEQWDDWLEKEGGRDVISEKIGKLKLYESYGSNVLYTCADVADEEEMRKLAEQIDNKFGPVNGIIHLAGITGEKAVSAIGETGIDACEMQFRPKVFGIYNLERLYRNKGIDFCLAVSSLCALLGGLGSAVYASANAFMDYFSYKKNKEGDFPLICVNWEAWQFNDEKKKWLTLDKLSLSKSEGLEVFKKVVSVNTVPQLVVSTGSIHKRAEQWLGRNSFSGDMACRRAGAPVTHKRPAMQSSYVPPQNSVERVVCGVWQELLGIDAIGIKDNFFELGGHSLLATRIISRLMGIFRLDIPIRSIFDNPTISGLSETIVNLWGGMETAEQIAVLHEQVDSLTDEEVRQMLDEMEAR